MNVFASKIFKLDFFRRDENFSNGELKEQLDLTRPLICEGSDLFLFGTGLKTWHYGLRNVRVLLADPAVSSAQVKFT